MTRSQRSFIFIVLILFCAYSKAGGIEDFVKDSFDSIVSNSTPPSSVSATAQRHGAFVGGSFRARAPVVDVELFTMKAPTMRSGCNGIDFNWGSFSFISKDELKNLLKAVVASAPSYAFGLAVDAMCSNCFSMMKDLARKVNELGKSLRNSCEITKSLSSSLANTKSVSGALQTANNWQQFDLVADDMQSGLTDVSNWIKDDVTPIPVLGDFFEVSNSSTTPSSGDRIATTPALQKRIETNVLWDVLKNNKFLEWFSGLSLSTDKVHENEIIMSLIGTVIYRLETDTAGVHTKDTVYIPDVISFDDFLYGKTVKIMDCVETVHCIRPDASPTVDVTLPDLVSEVANYFGEIRNVASAFKGSSATLSANLINFTQIDTFNSLAAIRAAKDGHEGMSYLLEGGADLLVVDVVYQRLKQLLVTMQGSLINQGKGIANKEANEKLKGRLKELEEWYATFEEKRSAFRERINIALESMQLVRGG